ncbi:hypothetical protein RUM43_004489 [Polyplax serrata]|uniref:Uncharacterized protein n=1 Tax=Polyplax serrata TaxID=468196 RepID=A0AAN8XN87_POLSC
MEFATKGSGEPPMSEVGCNWSPTTENNTGPSPTDLRGDVELLEIQFEIQLELQNQSRSTLKKS